MRWGLIFALLAMGGCAETYSDRYAEGRHLTSGGTRPWSMPTKTARHHKPLPLIAGACAIQMPV